MTSGNLDINGYTIWYEKFGTGSEVILLIPGALGVLLFLIFRIVLS